MCTYDKKIMVRGQPALETTVAKDLMWMNEEFVNNYQSSSSSAEIFGNKSVLSEMELAVRITLMGGKLKRNL